MTATWCFFFLAAILVDTERVLAVNTNVNVDVNANDDLAYVLKALKGLQTQNDALVWKIEELGVDNVRLSRENKLIMKRLASLEQENRVQESVIRDLNDKTAQSEQYVQTLVSLAGESYQARAVKRDTDKGHDDTPSRLDDKEDADDDVIRDNSDVANTHNGEQESMRRHPIQRSIRALLAEESGPVAFLATITPHDVTHLGVGQEIVFDNVITNLGHAYNPNHGNFIAPYHGVYMFSATIAYSHSGSDHVYAHFVLNGKLIVKFLGDTADMSSHTIVLELNPGDDVFIAHDSASDDVVLGDHYSSFAGQLTTLY